eukprot:gene31813-41288_t
MTDFTSSTKVCLSCSTAPPAIGPYSHAVRAEGPLIYVSGCLGLAPESFTDEGGIVCTKFSLVTGGVGAQARQALENMKAIVESSGSGLHNVVKCTVLLTDMSYFAEVNAVYAEYFPQNPPARTTFAVAGLPAGGLVEIDAICTAHSFL